jgi:TetR/AcrR family transcriptional regulator, regulator of biofilm formation and stress response
MRRKPRADSERTRRAILEATLRILRDHGLEALTHRAVAREAGVSLALTTYHFATKENLIAEALDLAVTETTDRLEQTAAELRTAGALTAAIVADRLADLMMGRLGDEQLAVVSVVELALAAARRPSLQVTTQAWNDAYHAIVVDLLERAEIHDPQGAAVIVVGMLEGLAFLQITESDPNFEHGILRPALERLLGSLR